MAEYEVFTVRRYRMVIECETEQQAREHGVGLLEMETPQQEYVESVKRL